MGVNEDAGVFSIPEFGSCREVVYKVFQNVVLANFLCQFPYFLLLQLLLANLLVFYVLLEVDEEGSFELPFACENFAHGSGCRFYLFGDAEREGVEAVSFSLVGGWTDFSYIKVNHL